MWTVIVAVVVSVFMSSTASAEYNYHRNKYGTVYLRDDSNDGYAYNNANNLGMNSRGYGSSGVKIRTLGDD